MSNLKNLTDIALIIALITPIASLIDFLLLPEQKKKFESWCEDITLKLDSINTIDWLSTWVRAARSADLAKGILAVLLMLMTLGILGLVLYLSWPRILRWELVVFILVLWIAAGIQWYIIEKVFDVIGQPIVAIMADVRTLPEYARRYFAVIALGAVVVVAVGCLYFSLFDVDTETPSVSTKLVGYIYGGLVLTYLGLFLDGVVTFLGAAVVCAARWGMAIAVAFMWRVSRFHKGPLAAVSAVVIMLLAVLRIALGIKYK